MEKLPVRLPGLGCTGSHCVLGEVTLFAGTLRVVCPFTPICSLYRSHLGHVDSGGTGGMGAADKTRPITGTPGSQPRPGHLTQFVPQRSGTWSHMQWAKLQLGLPTSHLPGIKTFQQKTTVICKVFGLRTHDWTSRSILHREPW